MDSDRGKRGKRYSLIAFIVFVLLVIAGTEIFVDAMSDMGIKILLVVTLCLSAYQMIRLAMGRRYGEMPLILSVVFNCIGIWISTPAQWVFLVLAFSMLFVHIGLQIRGGMSPR